MNNVLAARFASNTPVLMCGSKADWLNASLPAISAGIAQIEAREQKDAIEYMAYDDFWPAPDNWMSAFRPYKVVDGTLMIPVKGMLLHDFPYALGGWATGYAYILKAFERGMQDGSVDRIAMLLDTPGGEVAGCFDSVDKVFALRGQKPIRAFVNEAAYSAGYAWASVADKISMSRTAGVGSVGVVTAHMNVSKAMEKAGYEITFIHAGEHKVDGNPYGPLEPEVKARIQKRIDSMYTIFVSTTARNLGIEESVVRGTEALTYGAEDALAIGFAHEVLPFDEALAAFSGEPDNTAGEDDMPKPTDQEQAFSQADLDNARAEGHASGLKEGASAEQARIKGIMGCDAAKTRPTMAAHLALSTAQSVEEASGILAVSPEEKPAASTEAAQPSTPGANFEAAMGKGNPNLGSGEEAAHEENSAEATLKEFRLATGFGSDK